MNFTSKIHCYLLNLILHIVKPGLGFGSRPEKVTEAYFSTIKIFISQVFKQIFAL